jgi:high-affinity iron transporter
MLPAFLLALREGLEAALIVGIVLGALRKLGHSRQQTAVWQGVSAAMAVSLVVAVALYAVGAELEGAAEQIFEGVTMLLAAGILTWMIFWMQTQGRRMNQELETGVRQAITGMGSHWALFGVAFFAVMREGIETALFLTAATFTAGGQAGLDPVCHHTAAQRQALLPRDQRAVDPVCRRPGGAQHPRIQ